MEKGEERKGRGDFITYQSTQGLFNIHILSNMVIKKVLDKRNAFHLHSAVQWQNSYFLRRPQKSDEIFEIKKRPKSSKYIQRGPIKLKSRCLKVQVL